MFGTQPDAPSASAFANRRRLLDPFPMAAVQARTGEQNNSKSNSKRDVGARRTSGSRAPADIRIDEMAAELSRCDKNGALDICCRELREDMVATRERLREVDRKLRDLIKGHDELSCGDHETRVRATMVRSTMQQPQKKRSTKPPIASLRSESKPNAVHFPSHAHSTPMHTQHVMHSKVRSKRSEFQSVRSNKKKDDGMLSRLLARFVKQR
jgi:septum formation inhibitor MinC